MDEGNLHLHRIILQDPLALQRLAREMRLPDHPFDPDYVLHSLLTELAGRGRLKPFVEDPRFRGQGVLAYSALNQEKLRTHAQAVAPPEVYRSVDWERSQGKPLPERWPAGERLGFRVRVCPVIRGPSGHGRDGTKTQKNRPEVDAYLARCWREEESPGREAVYWEWLDSELGRYGACTLEEGRMTGFRLKRVLRRNGQRQSQGLTRPDALFNGVLRIADSEGFNRLLTRGLGRHRGFGFGMLLLTADAS